MAVSSAKFFELRHTRSKGDLWPMLDRVYGRHTAYEPFKTALLATLKSAWHRRPNDLKLLDLKRDLDPDWFQRSEMVGYACYTDRFAGQLKDVQDRLPYLQSLGVNYLHLMPLLEPRPRPNDGGYSIMDYRRVNPDLGTMDDLETLAGTMRANDMSLCIDLVLNHTAREHAWAQKALAGDPFYQAFYYFFDDDTQPRLYERSLIEIFPNDSPGNFTYVPELDKWVWTTFTEHQWDLNWSNPWVFLEIVKVMMFLANKGIDILRLDAVAFLWKRLGTRCQSEPEVHWLLRALRACSRIVSPAVLHLEEAITGPAEMLTYLGRGEHDGREGNLAYHNNLMVQYWSALASRDTTLMRHVMRENFPETVTNATYATYLRCHDDIGWAISDEDTGALGMSGHAHRAFLSDFYEGTFPGSFSNGALFQENKGTGDKRISGTLASLAGMEQPDGEEMAIHRILMGTALIASFGGVPLIYMGDEIATLNDFSYLQDEYRFDDSRWVHRPAMDWDRVAQAESGRDPQARVLAGTRHIMARRKATVQFHGTVPTHILEPDAIEVFGFSRLAPTGAVVCLFNMSDRIVSVSGGWLRDQGITEFYDLLSNAEVGLHEDQLVLLPYARVWMT